VKQGSSKEGCLELQIYLWAVRVLYHMTNKPTTNLPVADGGTCCDGVTITSMLDSDVPPFNTRPTLSIPVSELV